MIAIGRPVEGVSINGLEYLLDKYGFPCIFASKAKAITFLQDSGYDEKTYEELMDMFTFKNMSERLIDRQTLLFIEAVNIIERITKEKKTIHLLWKDADNENWEQEDVPIFSEVDDWNYDEYSVGKIWYEENEDMIYVGGVNKIESEYKVVTLRDIATLTPWELIYLANYLEEYQEPLSRPIIINSELETALLRKGAGIMYNVEAGYLSIERIDNVSVWMQELHPKDVPPFTPEQLSSNDEARKAAIELGLEFRDYEDSYRITNILKVDVNEHI